MKTPAILVPAVLILLLAGCAPEPVAPTSSMTPNPSVTATGTPKPTETPAASTLTIPDDCSELVPLSIVKEQFDPGFQSIFITANDGDPAAQDFASRNGLTCLWGIPNSDAGFLKVYVAERDSATDKEQVAEWKTAGYKECPKFLDACFVEEEMNEIGHVWTAHVLVDGFEMHIHATAASLDPLLVVARSAASNMGYR